MRRSRYRRTIRMARKGYSRRRRGSSNRRQRVPGNAIKVGFRL